MKFALDEFGTEDLESEPFEKIRSKKQKLKGRQSLNQLVRHAGETLDPGSKFNHPDLNLFSRLNLLDELISPIKMGKEASVFLGRNRNGLLAVKVYTDLRVRSFRRDESYREGRFIGDFRIEKAIEQKSQRGLEAHQALWVQEEFGQMQHLLRHGVSVPRAIAVNGLALLMEFIGDGSGAPAERLSDLQLEKAEAQEALRQSVENLKRIVGSGRVHGDYSTFNILWHNEKAVVIDFPQVMEFRNNRNAHAFLQRDVHSLCGSFLKHGVRVDENMLFREVRKLAPAGW
jgi:RIO kinase 1